MSLLLSSIGVVLVILGIANGFAKKMPLSLGLLNAVPFLGIVLFLAFLLRVPQMVAWGLLIVGAICVFAIPRNDRTAFYYVLFCAILFCFDYGLQFRSIDDYAYWGTISRYLYVFHALPNDASYIGEPYLTYTPGLAIFHYLLYTLAGQYQVFLGYFAQGLVALSAMMAFFDEAKPKASLCAIACIFIFWTFTFGTFLARMEADAYVALYFLAITWLIYKKGREAAPYILFPLLFLSLIKEIGFFFALVAWVMLVFRHPPRLCEPRRGEAIQSRSGLLRYARNDVGIFVSLLAIKGLWIFHTAHFHFHSFAHQVDGASLIRIFSDPYYYTVQWLYLKGIFFLRADNILHIPYGVLYLVLACIIGKIAEKRLLTIWILSGLIYLVMLYALQAIVFDVGHTNPTLLGFERYYNMFFAPFFISCIFYLPVIARPPSVIASSPSVIASVAKQSSAPETKSFIVYGILGLALLFLCVGKIERTYRYYKPEGYAALYKEVKEKHGTIYLSHVKEPAYMVVLPLRYAVMPDKVMYVK